MRRSKKERSRRREIPELRRSAWIHALRLIVTLGLCLVILRLVDGARLMAVLAETHWGWLGLAVLGYTLGQLMYALSGVLLFRRLDYGFSLPVLLANQYKGMFFNYFFVSSIGGDLYRIHDLRQRGSTVADGTAAMITQRLLSLLVLTILAIGTAPWLAPVEISLGSAVVLLLIVLAGAGWLLAGSAVDHVAGWVRRFPSLERGVGLWGRIRDSFCRLIRHVSVIGVLASLLVAQGFNILGAWAVAESQRLNLAPLLFCFIVPVALLAGALPISINGIGVREGLYVALLTAVGAARPRAVAFSLVVLTIYVGYTLVGGGLFLMGRRDETRDPDQPSGLEEDSTQRRKAR